MQSLKKRETLPERAERVIGRPLDLDEHDTHGASKSDGTKLPRRDQVLQAQRTHRNRTQQYLRELEKEVFRLREENESLFQRNGQLQLELQMMKGKADVNDVTSKGELDNPSQVPNAHEISQRSATSASHQLVQVDLTALASAVPQGSCANHPAEIDPPLYRSSVSRDTQSLQISHGTNPSTQMAIGFILELERPCLGHVKHAHMGYRETVPVPQDIDYNSGPGHVLTTSANLISRYRHRNLEQAVLDIPEANLDRLLVTSARLALDTEVTPVQIWYQMLDRIQITTLASQQIHAIAQEYSKYVYCNSFGAVVNRETAEAILSDIALRIAPG